MNARFEIDFGGFEASLHRSSAIMLPAQDKHTHQVML